MDPRTFWDDKFGPDRLAYGSAPNAFLAEHVDAFPSNGEVLSLGEGEGRNAVFLAERGLRVTAVDASPRGLEKLGQLAAARGVTVTAIAHDLAAFALGDRRWDGIYNIYCHLPPGLRTELYGRIQRALRPGGVFLTEQFAKDQLQFKSGGPKDENLLLSLDEFQQAFSGYEVAYAAAEKTTLDEGPLHQGPASVVRFIARKPALG
jgi:SAM-dependent methyltransferase